MPAEVRYMESEGPTSYAHLVVDGSGADDEPEFVVPRSSLLGIGGWTAPRDDTGRPPIPNIVEGHRPGRASDPGYVTVRAAA